MTELLALMALLSLIGGIDHFTYHVWQGELHRRPECRWELLSHAGHGLFAAGFFLATMVEFHGSWALLLVALAVVQLLNQVVDTLLEPGSREAQGGIPAGEYRLHGIINVLWGAVLLTTLELAWAGFGQPTAITWLGAPAGVPALAPWLGALAATTLGSFDLLCFLFGPPTAISLPVTLQPRIS